MKFEISEENQRKFNVILGIIFVITNLVGIPLTLTSGGGSLSGRRDNQPFGISAQCSDEVYYELPEFVSPDCVDELIEVRMKITRLEKKINDARSGN